MSSSDNIVTAASFLLELQQSTDKLFTPVGMVKSLADAATLSGHISIGMECLDRELWDPFPAMQKLRELGVKYARLQSGWGLTEKVRGVYDFAWLDAVVDALLANGVKPWLSLSYGNYLYASKEDIEPVKAGLASLTGESEVSQRSLENLHGLGHNPLSSPASREGWLNYVAAIVTRYRGKVDEFEIWNEPDVRIFFPIDGDWSDEYIELVKLTAPVIRRHNPAAVVIGGSGGRNWNMELLLKKGLGKYLDIDAFHGYHEYPEKFSFNAYRAYRAALDRFTPGLILWRGEAGCPSANPKNGHGALNHLHATEKLQACWVGRNIINDLAMKELARTSYFHLYDFMHFSRKYHYHYGVLREDYSPKPAYFVLQFIAKLLDGDTVGAEDLLLVPNSGPGGLQSNTVVRGFRRGGAPVFAVWLPGDSVDAPTIAADFTLWAVGTAAPQNPVAIDILTRRVYALKYRDARTLADVPVAPYPFVIADYSTFADVIETRGMKLDSVAAAPVSGQYDEA